MGLGGLGWPCHVAVTIRGRILFVMFRNGPCSTAPHAAPDSSRAQHTRPNVPSLRVVVQNLYSEGQGKTGTVQEAESGADPEDPKNSSMRVCRSRRTGGPNAGAMASRHSISRRHHHRIWNPI
jgi:hypothetical protein